MKLIDKLSEDMKAAMKGKDVKTLEVLRMVISSIRNKAIELNKELEDAEVIAVIKSDAKKIRDAMETFAQNARQDLADEAKREIAILETYLPEQMPDAELEAKVKAKIEELGAKASSEVGKVVGALAKELKGLVDGSRIKEKVEKFLNE
ncbi:MAG: GatB/YqeY domain-containing protein [Patescibacteria group bacterium]|jgi:hypothetical protein